MRGRGVQVFEVAGIPIRLDWTWFFVLVLIAWSLSGSWFPASLPGRSPAAYWALGIAGALGLFGSILLHELGHAIVARRHGVSMGGITLFLFGGVAEMLEEPPTAEAELRIAIAGPAVSVFLALACLGLAEATLPPAITGLLGYLGFINLTVVVFNLLPGFPLDGGRVLRALLWRRRQNLTEATRIAARAGRAVGFGLMLLGLFGLLSGNLLGGFWIGLIGLFLRNAADASYQQVLLRSLFGRDPVSRYMSHGPETVSPNLTTRALVEDHVYRSHHRLYPVVEHGTLVGCVSTRDIQGVPPDHWDAVAVRAIMRGCDDESVVRADTGVMDVLARMRRSGRSRLLVVTPDDRLAGVVTIKDLLGFFALKMELEPPAGRWDAVSVPPDPPPLARREER